MSNAARSALTYCLLIVLIFFGTLCFRLPDLPFTGADEPRYARIAEEMFRAGRWVTPTLEGYPWLEKPPLYYWITIPLLALFGIGEFASRLGPALCALLASMTVFWLGAKLWSRLVGFLGAAILLTTIGFCGFGRSASTDMPMTACLTVALAILTVAAVREDFFGWKVLSAYVFIGLAVLAKGPVALVLVLGIAVVFWLFDDRGESLRRWRPLIGLAIVSAVVIPWFWLAYEQNGFSFVLVFFVNHNLARYVSDIHHHSQPFYYFVPVLLGLLFPWTGWLPALVPRAIRAKLRDWRSWDGAELFLICWIGFPFVFFSISTSKLPGYILPILPPLALLLGVRLAGCMRAEGRDRWGTVPWLHLGTSLAVALAVPWAIQENYGENWRYGIPVSLVILGPGLLVFWTASKKRWGAAVRATVFQGIILVVGITQFGFPMLGAYHSTRDIARQAMASRSQAEPLVTFRFFHHTLHYYTGYRIEAQLQDSAALARYAAEHRSFLVVTESNNIGELRSLEGLTAVVVGVQGKFRLVRMESK